MDLVAGVDGCRFGWIGVLRRVAPPFEERVILARHFDEIANHPARPSIIAVDMPIGFPERIEGLGRTCDRAARALLSKRASCVFASPARAVLAEDEYRRACAVALETSDPPRQISKQMFHLFGKIREVDAVLKAKTKPRIFECHPEVAFLVMNGGAPLLEPKKRGNRPNETGLKTRESLLIRQGGSETFLRQAHCARSAAGRDDFLDACACAFTAARIFAGEAVSFPDPPEIDATGAAMAIFA